MDIMMMALKSLAVFQSYTLQGKSDPEHIVQAKKTITTLFEHVTFLSAEPDQPFLDANIAQVVADSFVFKTKEQLSQISL